MEPAVDESVRSERSPWIPWKFAVPWRFGGMHLRMFGLVAVALSPLLILNLLHHRSLQDETLRSAAKNSHLAAVVVASEYRARLHSVGLALRVASHGPQLHSAVREERDAYLKRLLGEQPELVNLGLVDGAGNFMASALPVPDGVTATDRSWYRRALNGHDIAVGELQKGRITGVESLNIALRIPGPTAGEHGVLFAAIGADHLSSFAAMAPLPEGSVCVVLDARGQVLVRNPPHPACPRGIVWSPWSNGYEPSLDEGVPEVRAGLDGARRIWGLRSFGPGDGGSVGTVAVGLLESSVLGPLQAAERTRWGFGILACAVAFLFAWRFIDVSLVDRLRALAEASRSVTAGAPVARRTVGYEPGALGDLERAFDEMATHLESSRGSLLVSERRTEGLMQDNVSLEKQFIEAQKMEALGRMAAAVAHDFRNNLTVVTGYAHLLRERVAGEPGSCRAIDEIIAAAERGDALTRQLLAFSRRERTPSQTCDLADCLPAMRGMLQSLVGSGVRVEILVPESPTPAAAGRVLLEQVVMNLAVNSRDAMPGGGTFTIGASTVVLDEHYASSVPGARVGRFQCISAQDTGTGMDEETHRRIFEPFFTTKDPGKGTGLGLSTVYGIVARAGGHIEVYTAPGRGTTFRIYIPVAEETAPGKVAPCASRSEVTSVVEGSPDSAGGAPTSGRT